MQTKTKDIISCALFAALTGILSQVAVPIGPVPINLATISVLCAGAMLGAKNGAISQVIFLAIGATGVPVFSLFRGGLPFLLGPTGGFIIGYILAAWIVGFFSEHMDRKILILGMAVGALFYFAVGTLWYMLSTNSNIATSLSYCVFPFIPGEIAKIILAGIVSNKYFAATANSYGQ